MITLQPKQVAELTNIAVNNALGIKPTQENPTPAPLIQEDLTGVIDAGIKLADADVYSNFLYELGVAVSARIFVERKYSSKAPNVYRTSFEYGQLIQKTRTTLDEAEDNQSYALVNGASYDDNIYYGGTVDSKVFKERVTWEIRKSIADEQIKNAFTGPQELGNFVSMIFTMVENSIQVKTDKLIMATINNMIGQTLKAKQSSNCINLWKLYKANHPDAVFATRDEDRNYTKFKASKMKLTSSLLENYSTLYNLNGAQTHTPKDKQHFVLLSEEASRFETYLDSDTFHNELVKLPYYETVSYWQGLGTTGSFEETSKINIKTNDGSVVEQGGIIGVIFDHDALGINNIKQTVRTKYTNSGEFVNYWFKQVMGYFNDFDENFVVFYEAEE